MAIPWRKNEIKNLQVAQIPAVAVKSVSAPIAVRAGARALWQRIVRFTRKAPRQLRLAESLPLGERRFVAVLEFEEARFLVGGTSSSLVLLTRLRDSNSADIYGKKGVSDARDGGLN